MNHLQQLFGCSSVLSSGFVNSGSGGFAGYSVVVGGQSVTQSVSQSLSQSVIGGRYMFLLSKWSRRSCRLLMTSTVHQIPPQVGMACTLLLK
jgi:hypothetical protein